MKKFFSIINILLIITFFNGCGATKIYQTKTFTNKVDNLELRWDNPTSLTLVVDKTTSIYSPRPRITSEKRETYLREFSVLNKDFKKLGIKKIQEELLNKNIKIKENADNVLIMSPIEYSNLYIKIQHTLINKKHGILFKGNIRINKLNRMLILIPLKKGRVEIIDEYVETLIEELNKSNLF